MKLLIVDFDSDVVLPPKATARLTSVDSVDAKVRIQVLLMSNNFSNRIMVGVGLVVDVDRNQMKLVHFCSIIT